MMVLASNREWLTLVVLMSGSFLLSFVSILLMLLLGKYFLTWLITTIQATKSKRDSLGRETRPISRGATPGIRQRRTVGHRSRRAL